MLYLRTSVPPSFTEPESTSQKRERSEVSVVFPPPEGPTMAVVVFWGIFNDMPLIIFFCSYAKVMFSALRSQLAGVISSPLMSI